MITAPAKGINANGIDRANGMNLNRVLYFGDFFVCPVAIMALAIAALAKEGMEPIGLWVLAFAIGCGAWTLLEYAIHRWIYHNVGFFDKMHDAHHQDPTGMIGAPSFLSIGLIFVLFYLPLFFINADIAGGFTSGVLLGYFAYMLVHHASHHWAPRHGSLLYRLRIAHMAHHYHDEEGNFGVTTAFWDKVFGTYVERRRSGEHRDVQTSV